MDEQELTVMAIREKLMEYFKGDCIQRFIINDVLSWEAVTAIGGHQYRYRQSQNSLLAKRQLFLGNIPLLEVQHQPDTIRFYDRTLKADATLDKIQSRVEEALKRYLRGVQVEHLDSGMIDVSDLKKWLAYSRFNDSSHLQDPDTVEQGPEPGTQWVGLAELQAGWVYPRQPMTAVRTIESVRRMLNE